MIRQTYNKKTKRWIKYKTRASGKTEITGVKKREPNKPFKGVKVR